jgi:hypothetical protein
MGEIDELLARGFDEYESDDGDDLDRPRRARRRPNKTIPDVVVVRVTDDAILVRGLGLSSDPFGLEDATEEAWIPRSQVCDDSEVPADAVGGEEGALVITGWLAEKRGL